MTCCYSWGQRAGVHAITQFCKQAQILPGFCTNKHQNQIIRRTTTSPHQNPWRHLQTIRNFLHSNMSFFSYRSNHTSISVFYTSSNTLLQMDMYIGNVVVFKLISFGQSAYTGLYSREKAKNTISVRLTNEGPTTKLQNVAKKSKTLYQSCTGPIAIISSYYTATFSWVLNRCCTGPPVSLSLTPDRSCFKIFLHRVINLLVVYMLQ